jgi:hypothetical protein
VTCTISNFCCLAHLRFSVREVQLPADQPNTFAAIAEQKQIELGKTIHRDIVGDRTQVHNADDTTTDK